MQPGTERNTNVPINYCTGPAQFTLNMRVTKTFGFGGSNWRRQAGRVADRAGRRTSGRRPGGGGGGGGRGGGGGGFGGGGSSTGKRYNLSFGVDVQNLFGNEDLATPQGSLSSPNFGQSTQRADRTPRRAQCAEFRYRRRSRSRNVVVSKSEGPASMLAGHFVLRYLEDRILILAEAN